MKYALCVFFVSAYFVSCTPTSVEVENEKKMLSFGEEKVLVEQAVSVNELFKKFKPNEEEQEFTFKGKITEVCQSAGCWVRVKKEDGTDFMVRFRDHFGIPKDTKAGTEAYFHGLAYMDTIPVADLKHYAEDARKSKEEIEKIVSPEISFQFEADGITFEGN